MWIQKPWHFIERLVLESDSDLGAKTYPNDITLLQGDYFMSSFLVGFNTVPLSWLPAEGLLLISLRKLSQSGELPNALATAAPHSRTCAVFPAFPLWGARPKWAPVEGDISICHQIPSHPLLDSTLSSPPETFNCFLLLGIHSPQASHDLPLSSFRSLLITSQGAFAASPVSDRPSPRRASSLVSCL